MSLFRNKSLLQSLFPVFLTRGGAVAAVGVSRHGSRHIIPPNLDIKVIFKYIQDRVVGGVIIVSYNNSILKYTLVFYMKITL